MKIKNNLFAFFAFFVILFFSQCDKKDPASPTNEEPPAEEVTGNRFEPPDGECLFILGQASEKYMEDYLNKVRKTPLPAGFAFYTSLSDGAVQGDLPRYKTFLDKYPNTALQLAIWTGERQWGDPGYYLDDIVNGKYDANISALANLCKSFGRPVFIRFGYEFDGWHNAYPPDKYVAAYKYFVDKMNSHGVKNVAYVWHSWGVGAYYGHDDFPKFYPALAEGGEVTQELWYPGDDYVDWLGLSVFGTGWGNLASNDVIQWFISFAREHDKPIMLAETAAIKTSNVSDPKWVISSTEWFNQVFTLCNSNDEVKAFTYINVDWEEDNPSSTWGNTQIQSASSAVKWYWYQQIESFVHADSAFYSVIGYSE